MRYSRYALVFLLLVACVPTVSGSSGADRIAVPTGRGAEIELVSGDIGHVSYGAGGDFVWDAPAGDRALVAFPLPDGVSIDDYGLVKFDIAIDGGPVDVMVFIEKPGEKRRVYRPIDVFEPPPGFRTIHLDITCPEIVREGHDKPDSPRIAFNLWAMNTGYPEQEPRRRITIRNARLSKRRLDVRWNGVDYRTVDGPGESLVYEYPVAVRNDDDVTRMVEGNLTRTSGRYGAGAIVPERASLAPGDSTVFTVRLTLPRGKAGDFPPLFCEWFLPLFTIDGAPDSDEGILRSSDLIELPLIVMPDFEGPVAFYSEDGLGEMRRLYETTAWGKREGDALIKNAESILAGDLSIPNGPGWARAYYYCHEHRCVLQYQGPGKHYCPVGGEYRTVDFEGVDLDRDYRAGEHNTAAARARTLALAFALTGDNRFAEGARSILGQYRDAYFTYDWMDLDTSRITIDKGRMHFAKYMETYIFRNMIEALGILRAAGGIPDNEARDIEENLLKPALVEITDYRMDVLCRQTTITTTALIGGLALRHAPLVAFATASPFGYYSIRKWGATADGIGHGHGYAQNGYAFHLCEMGVVSVPVRSGYFRS